VEKGGPSSCHGLGAPALKPRKASLGMSATFLHVKPWAIFGSATTATDAGSLTTEMG
jgi:hypothetical protein